MGSVVPVAIDALLALAEARCPGVQRFDGPEPGWPEQEFIAVGLSPEDLEIPVIRTERGLEVTTESADVVCLIRVATGNTSSRPSRVRAFELLNALTAGLDEDNTLGGVVGQAELTTVDYRPAAGRRSRRVDLVLIFRVINF